MDKLVEFARKSPLLLGSVLAVVVYLVPEVKPIACGGVFALPSLLG